MLEVRDYWLMVWRRCCAQELWTLRFHGCGRMYVHGFFPEYRMLRVHPVHFIPVFPKK